MIFRFLFGREMFVNNVVIRRVITRPGVVLGAATCVFAIRWAFFVFVCWFVVEADG